MFSDADVFVRSSGRRKIWTELFTGKRSCNSTLLHVLLYWKMDHRVADRSSVVSCFFVVETGRKKEGNRILERRRVQNPDDCHSRCRKLLQCGDTDWERGDK